MINRRSFIGTASLAMMAAGMPFAASAEQKSKCGKKVPFKFGMAGFSCHRLSVDETLDLMKRLDLQYLCIKDFHLPFKSTDAQIAEFKQKSLLLLQDQQLQQTLMKMIL